MCKWVLFLLATSPAWASGSSLEPSFQLDWYNRFLHRPTKETFANPGNRFVEIPQEVFESDLRPSLSLESGVQLLKINPRMITQNLKIEFPSEKRNTTKAELFLNELYYQYTGDQHLFVIGLQNYQWGPAEMLSPSNPIFRFLQDQRSFFFLQRGRNIVRWNWTIDKSLSVVAMSEVSKNNVDLPREEQKFSPNGLIKIEKSFDEATDYVGVVVGVTPSQEGFVGEYGSVNLGKITSLYFDARHQMSTHNFYPDRNAYGTYQFKQVKAETESVYTLATVGLRFETRVDFRAEYIYNGLGLNDRDWKRAQSSLTTLTPYLGENVRRFFRSGRDLQRQNYMYLSGRVPDLGPGEIYTFFVRYFHSLDDSSSVSQVLVDRATGDHFNLYFELATYQGSRKAEFSSLISTETSVGFKWTY